MTPAFNAVFNLVNSTHGHWDVNWGDKVRDKYLPNGQKVDHFGDPIPFWMIEGAAAGAGWYAVGSTVLETV